LMIEPYIAAGTLTPVLSGYPPPEAGIFVVRPPGDFPPRKVKVLIEILLEHFADRQ
jgi:DNA-binding transcriptional LysR family regulator